MRGERLTPVTLGPLYDVRLEDLGRWDRFEAACLQCRNRTIIDPERLRQRWPGYTRVIELERKLRCQNCGNRDGNSLKICRLKRD